MIASELEDGFKEIFSLQAPLNTVKYFNAVRIGQEYKIYQGTNQNDLYLSLDSKSIKLYEKGPKFTDKPLLTSVYKYPKNQSNYIISITHIPSLKAYIAAAADLTFQIFSKKLELQEKIPHDERMVTNLVYNKQNDVIVLSTTIGLSLWKISQNSSLDNTRTVLSKVYSFDNCLTGWVNSLILEEDNVLLTIDRSAYDVSISSRKLVARLENIHDDTVTSICWYPKSQLYVTGCR